MTLMYLTDFRQLMEMLSGLNLSSKLFKNIETATVENIHETLLFNL